MKGQWKGFVCGVLTTVLVLGLAGTALATVGKKAVDVDYNNIKVTLDGELVKLVNVNGDPVEPFAIEGTTYLPVRAVATALGLGVGWDQANTTVLLTSDGSEPVAQTPAPAPVVTETPTPTETDYVQVLVDNGYLGGYFYRTTGSETGTRSQVNDNDYVTWYDLAYASIMMESRSVVDGVRYSPLNAHYYDPYLADTEYNENGEMDAKYPGYSMLCMSECGTVWNLYGADNIQLGNLIGVLEQTLKVDSRGSLARIKSYAVDNSLSRANYTGKYNQYPGEFYGYPTANALERHLLDHLMDANSMVDVSRNVTIAEFAETVVQCNLSTPITLKNGSFVFSA